MEKIYTVIKCRNLSENAMSSCCQHIYENIYLSKSFGEAQIKIPQKTVHWTKTNIYTRAHTHIYVCRMRTRTCFFFPKHFWLENEYSLFSV